MPCDCGLAYLVLSKCTAVVTGVCICGYASLVESSIAEAKSKIKELEVLRD